MRSAERQGELDEEHRRREELVQDIAYIRSQVTDLASTKGSLLVRLDTMANRETKRQASAQEMSSALQDAEAVAADRAMGMRRMQVRAEKLESELAEARAALSAGQGALSPMQPRSLPRRTLCGTSGTNCRVQLQFLQKQVAAHQRAKPVAPTPLAAMPAKVTCLPALADATPGADSRRRSPGWTFPQSVAARSPCRRWTPRTRPPSRR